MEHYAAIKNCQDIQYHEKMFLECCCLERKSQNTMIPFFKCLICIFIRTNGKQNINGSYFSVVGLQAICIFNILLLLFFSIFQISYNEKTCF